MKYKKGEPHSALDLYDKFTGWDNQDYDDHHNILQQLKNNLHNLQHLYQSKEPSQPVRKKSRLKNKENEVKLPSIHSSPHTEQLLQKKGSFLTFKNRNLLKEAIQNSQKNNKRTNKTQLMIHEQQNRDRPRHKAKVLQIQQSRDSSKMVVSTQNVMVRRASRLLEEIKTRALTDKSGLSNGEESCQFSDEKLLINQNRVAPIEHRHRLLYFRRLPRSHQE